MNSTHGLLRALPMDLSKFVVIDQSHCGNLCKILLPIEGEAVTVLFDRSG